MRSNYHMAQSWRPRQSHVAGLSVEKHHHERGRTYRKQDDQHDDAKRNVYCASGLDDLTVPVLHGGKEFITWLAA